MTLDDEMEEYSKPDMLTVMKQQVVKEAINDTNLSSIPRNFYQEVHLWCEDATAEELKEMQVSLNKLFRVRNGKLLSYACVLAPDGYPINLADEEWDFCTLMFQKSMELRDKIMGKKRGESVRE